MKLTLDRLDLKPEHSKMNCSQTNFEHFQAVVQKVILAVGRATFIEYDGRSYNAIYPPKENKT